MTRTNKLKIGCFCHWHILDSGHCFVFRDSDFGFPERKTSFRSGTIYMATVHGFRACPGGATDRMWTLNAAWTL